MVCGFSFFRWFCQKRSAWVDGSTARGAGVEPEWIAEAILRKKPEGGGGNQVV